MRTYQAYVIQNHEPYEVLERSPERSEKLRAEIAFENYIIKYDPSNVTVCLKWIDHDSHQHGWIEQADLTPWYTYQDHPGLTTVSQPID